MHLPKLAVQEGVDVARVVKEKRDQHRSFRFLCAHPVFTLPGSAGPSEPSALPLHLDCGSLSLTGPLPSPLAPLGGPAVPSVGTKTDAPSRLCGLNGIRTS